MNLVKERVQHRQYGVGIVKKQTDTTIEVKFDAEISPKRFIYPSVFSSYLVLCNPDLQKTMTDELQEIRDKIEAAHKSSQEETKRIQAEANTNLAMQKRAAAKKKATAAKSTRAVKAPIEE